MLWIGAEGARMFAVLGIAAKVAGSSYVEHDAY